MQKMGSGPMIELMANPALRTFVRTWSIILVGSCGGMVAVVPLRTLGNERGTTASGLIRCLEPL